MATIINTTPFIPLANPVGSVNSSMAKLQSEIQKGKHNTKKKKGKKRNAQIQAPANTAKETDTIPVVEEVEVILPEPKVTPVTIAHTEEKEAAKAALPDERMQGLYADFEGIKNEILTAHKNGAILPEGFAKAIRDVADVIDAVEKVDSEKRIISLDKKVYNTGYVEPKYDINKCQLSPPVYNIPLTSTEYKRCYIPLHCLKVDNVDTMDYSGKSILQVISDNLEYIADGDISTTDNGTAVVDLCSNIARSGYLIYDRDKELSDIVISPWNYSHFRLELAIPRDVYYSMIAPKPEVTVCTLLSGEVSNYYRREGLGRDIFDYELSSIINYHKITGDDIKDISRYHHLPTHALNFDDISALIHNPDVLIAGFGNQYPSIAALVHNMYPRAVAPDGNIIICNSEMF